MLELEKNLVVHRLKDGRKHAQEKADKEIQRLKCAGKKLKPGMLTQKGKPKVMGSKSWLATFGKPTPLQRVRLQMAFKARARGDFGWRTLRDKNNKVLKIKLKSHEAARRFCNEFRLYYKA